jgi:hypothetical protein
MSTILSKGSYTEIVRAVRILIEAGNENPSFRIDYERRLMAEDGTVLATFPLDSVQHNYDDIRKASVDVPGVGAMTGEQLFGVLVAWADGLRVAQVEAQAKAAQSPVA